MCFFDGEAYAGCEVGNAIERTFFSLLCVRVSGGGTDLRLAELYVSCVGAMGVW